MAVVQISRIQQRRGKRNSASGVPQLSSAELAWAVDTQELFIGNGSVAEGAPYVGNTKILTEHDNILNVVSGYAFATNDNAITDSTSRRIQAKLDEYVSVLDFGAIGDGYTDNTVAFQTALNQLFLNTDYSYRRVLTIPAGTYKLAANLYIPSNTIIKGDSSNAILDIGNNVISFITSTGDHESLFTSANRPTTVHLSNFTIKRAIGQVNITGLIDSKFSNLTIIGNYTLATAIDPPVSTIIDTGDYDHVHEVAVYNTPVIAWTNTLIGTGVTRIEFAECTFNAVSSAIQCTQLTAFSTTISITDCKFSTVHTGIKIIGVVGQETDWQVTKCHFRSIASHAIYATNTAGIQLHYCLFRECGNGTNSSLYPIVPMVLFDGGCNNIVLFASSDRIKGLATHAIPTTLAVADVINSHSTTLIDQCTLAVLVTNNTMINVFSTATKHVDVIYTLVLGNATRTGKLSISVNVDSSAVNLSDDYNFISSTGDDAAISTFEFMAVMKDNNNDDINDTIALMYRNPSPTGESGMLYYNINYRN